MLKKPPHLLLFFIVTALQCFVANAATMDGYTGYIGQGSSYESSFNLSRVIGSSKTITSAILNIYLSDDNDPLVTNTQKTLTQNNNNLTTYNGIPLNNNYSTYNILTQYTNPEESFNIKIPSLSVDATTTLNHYDNGKNFVKTVDNTQYTPQYSTRWYQSGGGYTVSSGYWQPYTYSYSCGFLGHNTCYGTGSYWVDTSHYAPPTYSYYTYISSYTRTGELDNYYSQESGMSGASNYSYVLSRMDLDILNSTKLFDYIVSSITGDGIVTSSQLILTLGDIIQAPAPAATPEPGTMILMGAGAAGMAFMRRRRAKAEA